MLMDGWVEEEAVANWSKSNSLLKLVAFDSNDINFYHSRLIDEPTGMIVSLSFLWLLGNVANSVETKVLHKTTPISSTTIY